MYQGGIGERVGMALEGGEARAPGPRVWALAGLDRGQVVLVGYRGVARELFAGESLTTGCRCHR
ncbi:MAG: hypothetical protein QME93_05345 [Bacillota bacterium]|nr:hypothetical protein [Bacillota bacterium]MDI7249478.1 hypothetical protein [Bacillota bacterium]